MRWPAAYDPHAWPQNLSNVTVSHASARADVLDELGGYVQATDITPTYATTYGERYGLGIEDETDDRRRRRGAGAAFAPTGGAGATAAPTTPFRLYSYTLLHETVAGEPRMPRPGLQGARGGEGEGGSRADERARWHGGHGGHGGWPSATGTQCWWHARW